MAPTRTLRRSPQPAPAEAVGAIQPVNRATLPQAIIKSITDLIMQRVWKPGDMIPSEKELAAQFGVGRSTIREGVKILAILGVLEAKAGEGSFVRGPGPRALNGAFEWGLLLSDNNREDLADMRVFIEVECARRAAINRTPEQADALSGIMQRMRSRKTDNAQFRELGNDFHNLVASASGNVLFESIVMTMQQIVRIWYPGNATRASTIAEHTAIAVAIIDGDSEAAAEAMRAHILSASERLRTQIKSEAS
jgi:GntR family transcriptional repressor for pyruvate dehydrogenase complex